MGPLLKLLLLSHLHSAFPPVSEAILGYRFLFSGQLLRLLLKGMEGQQDSRVRLSREEYAKLLPFDRGADLVHLCAQIFDRPTPDLTLEPTPLNFLHGRLDCGPRLVVGLLIRHLEPV